MSDDTRVRHWKPDGRYPGYETRINEQGHRETRPMKTPDGVPAGYARQMVQVWKGPKDIVIIGTPDESEDEETGHNCDAMGCGWDHVLWRIPIPEANTKQPEPSAPTPEGEIGQTAARQG